MGKFTNLDTILSKLPKEEQLEIADSANELALRYNASKIHKAFCASLEEAGAKLFARLPSGKEIELDIHSHA